MNQILYSNNNKTKKIIIIVVALIIFVILFSVIFSLINMKSNKILKGVSIDNIDIGGINRDDVTSTLNKEISSLKNKNVVLKLNEKEYEYKGEDFGITLDKNSISSAYEYGRSGNLISDNYTILASYFGKKKNIDGLVTTDSSRIDSIIMEIEGAEQAVAVDDTYKVEKNKLIISKGRDGINIDKEELKNKILAEITNPSDTTIDIPVKIGAAKRVSINDVYDEVHIDKVDASYTPGDKFEVIKEVTGISFDKEDAQAKYDNADDDTSVEIALVETKPTKTIADLDSVLFKDVLGEFTTKYDATYTNRVTNMQVAANHVNGTILYPGDEFSYNKVVGERTAARGFKDAHVYSGGKVVDGLGGGICQVSSTIYNAALLANLEITNRVAHMMHTGYVKPSFDATVVYGSIDFKFKNNRETPIKITVSMSKGVQTVKIFGLKKADEPKVELESKILSTTPYKTITEYDKTMDEGTSKVTQSPMNGYVSEGYKILKDSKGNQISRTLISKDTYKPTDKIVTVGTKVVEKPVEDNPVPENPGNSGETQNPPAPIENPNQGSTLPTGWDTPENPYYNGNY